MTIVLEALVGIVPPLLIKRIIDTAIPQQDNGMVTTLALIMVAIAFGDALLSLGERWWSARIGEGLIFDLRSLAVRPHAAHADRVLHPHADRRARSAA